VHPLLIALSCKFSQVSQAFEDNSAHPRFPLFGIIHFGNHEVPDIGFSRHCPNSVKALGFDCLSAPNATLSLHSLPCHTSSEVSSLRQITNRGISRVSSNSKVLCAWVSGCVRLKNLGNYLVVGQQHVDTADRLCAGQRFFEFLPQSSRDTTAIPLGAVKSAGAPTQDHNSTSCPMMRDWDTHTMDTCGQFRRERSSCTYP